jgi:hypothetical protein
MAAKPPGIIGSRPNISIGHMMSGSLNTHQSISKLSDIQNLGNDTVEQVTKSLAHVLLQQDREIKSTSDAISIIRIMVKDALDKQKEEIEDRMKRLEDLLLYKIKEQKDQLDLLKEALLHIGKRHMQKIRDNEMEEAIDADSNSALSDSSTRDTENSCFPLMNDTCSFELSSEQIEMLFYSYEMSQNHGSVMSDQENVQRKYGSYVYICYYGVSSTKISLAKKVFTDIGIQMLYIKHISFLGTNTLMLLTLNEHVPNIEATIKKASNSEFFQNATRIIPDPRDLKTMKQIFPKLISKKENPHMFIMRHIAKQFELLRQYDRPFTRGAANFLFTILYEGKCGVSVKTNEKDDEFSLISPLKIAETLGEWNGSN